MKKHLYQLIALMAVCIISRGQTMSNTSSNITLTSTCLTIPNGTYTLNIYYNDVASTATPVPSTNQSCTATVSTSGSVITIAGSGVMWSLPTVSSTGYYDLSDCGIGTIQLTSGSTNYYLYWDVHNIYCESTHPSLTGLSAALVSGKVNLSWTLNNSSKISHEVFYRSTDGGVTYYEIGESASNPGSYTDNAPGANNYYYVAGYTNQGSCITTSAVSKACGTCSYTPPSPSSCSESMTGSYTLCNLQDHEIYSVSGISPNLNNCKWSISPAYAKILPVPCSHGASVYLLRNGSSSSGIATLTLSQSACTSNQTFSLLIGNAALAVISVNANTSNPSNCSATLSPLVPGAVDSAYHWTLNLGSNGTTYYTGIDINFSLPCSSGGSLTCNVNTPCGQAQASTTVYNSNRCGMAFIVTPNPANNTATVSATSSATTIRSVDVFDKTGNKRQSNVFDRLSTVTLNVASLPADQYVLKITSTLGEVTTTHLMIVK